MSSNPKVILDKLISEQKTRYTHLSIDKFFVVFCCEQVLKRFDLSDDELLAGIVDASDDGGIDGFYVLLDGAPLAEDFEVSQYKGRYPKFSVFMIQAKNSDRFKENALDKVNTTVRDIFDLGKAVGALRNCYNNRLLNTVEVFRTAYTELASRAPELSFSYYYANKGSVATLPPKFHHKAGGIEEALKALFPEAESTAGFLDARKLVSLHRKGRPRSFKLRLQKEMPSDDGLGHVALVGLSDYYSFITDGQGNFIHYLFESNVRDWQGNIEVNKSIQNSLVSNEPLDFWWLNNGITIVASGALPIGRVMTLNSPQVVNGLQTSRVIYDYFRTFPQKEENRTILVRIVVAEETSTRERIIKATNSQTYMPPAQLRALDDIQKDIEEHFEQKGLYYDRRKNYHKNRGRPADKIVGIPKLAQAVMAILLREPNNARGRPTTLIKRDDDYKEVFSDKTPLATYLYCIRTVMATYRVLTDMGDVRPEERDNLVYHISAAAVGIQMGKTGYPREALIPPPTRIPSHDEMEEAARKTIGIATDFQQKHDWDIRRIAKSKEFDKYLFQELETAASN